MTACELAWSRLPQAGMQVHRGLLYDQMNLQAVARHAIASQPASHAPGYFGCFSFNSTIF